MIRIQQHDCRAVYFVPFSHKQRPSEFSAVVIARSFACAVVKLQLNPTVTPRLSS
jgi:hypothetical protein